MSSVDSSTTGTCLDTFYEEKKQSRNGIITDRQEAVSAERLTHHKTSSYLPSGPEHAASNPQVTMPCTVHSSSRPWFLHSRWGQTGNVICTALQMFSLITIQSKISLSTAYLTSYLFLALKNCLGKTSGQYWYIAPILNWFLMAATLRQNESIIKHSSLLSHALWVAAEGSIGV